MTRTAWTVLALLMAATPAAAQLVGSNASGLGGGSIDNSFGGTGSGNNSTGTGNANSLANTQAFQAPTIGAFNPLTAPVNPFLSNSNAFAPYFANSFYQGRAGRDVPRRPRRLRRATVRRQPARRRAVNQHECVQRRGRRDADQ